MNIHAPRFHSMRALAAGVANCLGNLMTPLGPRPPPTPPKASVTALPVAHSALFDSARGLLLDGYDVSAAVVRLREAHPHLSVSDAQTMLREAACILHCSGERPDVGNGGW